MKIVVSGSAGTGKTTLIKHIAPVLEIPIIPDFADSVLKERGYTSFKHTSDDVAREIRIEALKRKIETEESKEHFISDKGVVDYFAYWMILEMPKATKEQNEFFEEASRKHVSRYDIVIIPPFGRIPIEDNQIRHVSPSYQFRNHCMIKGLYNEFGVPFLEYALDLKKSPEQVVNELGIII